jgi:hypothetical protein
MVEVFMPLSASIALTVVWCSSGDLCQQYVAGFDDVRGGHRWKRSRSGVLCAAVLAGPVAVGSRECWPGVLAGMFNVWVICSFFGSTP